MAMMGIAFSLIPAIMWPSVAYVVEENKLGTAYGLMTLIQNIGLAGFNLVIGWANDYAGASAANPGGYRLGMSIFSTPRLLRGAVRLAAVALGAGPARPRTRDDQGRVRPGGRPRGPSCRKMTGEASTWASRKSRSCARAPRPSSAITTS